MAPAPREQLTEAVRQLARKRDAPLAWEALFAISWPTALATTHRILGGQLDLAEDAAQEAYQRLVRYCDFGKLTNGDAFLAYLQAVCRNVALDVRRQLSSSARQQSSERIGETPTADTHGSLDPDESIRGDELRRDLVHGLNEDDQRLFVLLLEEHSLAEIAAELGVSYSTAGVRVHRLRTKLRKRLHEL
jgi:RNA polymerase sigma factor (sigma-70 family)